MLPSSFFRSGARALVLTSTYLFLSAATALFGQSPSSLDGYDPNVNGVILVATTQRDGKVIVGGAFTTVQPNGVSDKVDRNYLARFNPDGSLDQNFNPNANDQINAIALQSDGKVLIGGLFTTLQPNDASAPTTRNHFARLNSDGSLDTAFNPNVTGSLAPQV
ncbi:MAG: delta-60 repeat domain-containing protein, partial [Opitutaceae bacterium]